MDALFLMIFPYVLRINVLIYIWFIVVINKHLMTGHKGNSEFWFPETLNVPRGEAEGGACTFRPFDFHPSMKIEN